MTAGKMEPLYFDETSAGRIYRRRCRTGGRGVADECQRGEKGNRNGHVPHKNFELKATFFRVATNLTGHQLLKVHKRPLSREPGLPDCKTLSVLTMLPILNRPYSISTFNIVVTGSFENQHFPNDTHYFYQKI